MTHSLYRERRLSGGEDPEEGFHWNPSIHVTFYSQRRGGVAEHLGRPLLGVGGSGTAQPIACFGRLHGVWRVFVPATQNFLDGISPAPHFTQGFTVRG